MLLGDFNACVGSRVEEDEWWYVRGPHGYGETNEAGKELRAFLSSNEAIVCNTWFRKKANRKQTWQHPKSKQWHCIDYAIIGQYHRRRCLDVSVMCGTDCNTDHQLLRVKLLVGRRNKFHKGRVGSRIRKFDMTKLQGRNVDDEGKETIRGVFHGKIYERVKELWKGDGSVEEKWESVKAGLCETAERVLGYETRRQPDWFRESEADLKP